tara:strand:- start:1034 stop:2836 length:1803 start_codon:yes stop_codon:yes gene_type:complete
MKFIGQYIQSFIARFRNDVYLESTSSGTIASGGNLGLDSNNKIVKATSTSHDEVTLTGTPDYITISGQEITRNQIDLTADVTGVLPSANLDSDTAHLSGTQTFTGDKSFSGTTLFTNSSLARPIVNMKNTGNVAQGGSFIFSLDKGAAGADSDIPGIIYWQSDDDAQAQTTFGQIYTQVADATNGQEAGAMYFRVAEYDGTITTGLKLDGDTDADGEIDVTIGAGAASVTTIAGTLTMGSTAFVNNSGVVQVATQGTIDHDSLANFVSNEHIDWTTDQGSTNIHAGNYINTEYSEATSSDAGLMSTTHHDKLDGIETSADVTDTTNVTAAGALMDSELTDLAGVKGVTISTLQVKPSEGAFANGDKTKLDAIEASADVTDATNVTAAGALMDSECSSLASVKALDQGVATGDSPQFAGINLGHADDTTFARSASGTATIEGKEIMTKDKKIHIQQTSFSRDIATTEFFIPFNSTAESTNITNVNVPMVMPVSGKLLKLHMRASQHHNTSSNTVTFKLYDVDDGENWTTGASSVLGTKVIDGTSREDIMVADFQDLTTSGASGTNAFSAGDSIGVTLQNSQDLATTNYLVTMVFELDFSSY